MKVTTYYARRDTTVDGKTVKAGEVLGELHSDLDPTRVVNAIASGLADATPPGPAGEVEPDDR